MEIKLKRLTIVNFKGIQRQDIEFSHTTSIYGDNATGKTTIFDAFLWLFFGKNCEGVSQFEVKRLDAENKFIKDLESEVTALIHVDQQEIEVRKVLRQKWVQRRGELGTNYNGDENLYFWNDVPLKEGEFKVKVKAIVDEMLFRLITNPFFFNSLKWQERRNILIEIAGHISNTDVMDSCVTVENKGQFNDLIMALNSGKTLDEFKRELAAKKKKVKDTSESIPFRIDEVRRGMPKDINFESLKKEMSSLLKEQSELESKMNDELAAEKDANELRTSELREYNQKVQQRQQSIFDTENKLRNIQFEAKQQASEKSGKLDAQINSLRTNIDEKQKELDRYTSSIESLKNSLLAKETDLNKLRDEYVQIDETKFHADFNESEFHCPTCKQQLPDSDIESKKAELIENFNQDKIKKLASIHQKADDLKAEIEALNTRITNGNKAIESLKSDLGTVKDQIQQLLIDAANEEPIETIVERILAENKSYQSLKSELNRLNNIVLTEPVFDRRPSETDTKAKFIELNNKIMELQKQLSLEDVINADNIRITELMDQEAKLAQELAALEGSEHAIMLFTKAKIDSLERKINGRFKTVKFKMFEQQVNGGETECCETLVNSNGSFVPFADANNAAKINAGIDIINTLCDHYHIYAPIFIDNRESVTKLIDSNSQIVNLIVSAQDKKLRVA